MYLCIYIEREIYVYTYIYIHNNNNSNNDNDNSDNDNNTNDNNNNDNNNRPRRRCNEQHLKQQWNASMHACSPIQPLEGARRRAGPERGVNKRGGWRERQRVRRDFAKR